MCSENVNVQVKFVQKQFLCCVPVHTIDWLNVFDKFETIDQEALVGCTVNLDVVLKYPVKISYQKEFLKFAIRRLEEQGSEVSDCVYDAFGRVVALAESSGCFKHYSIETGKIISLKENPNIISEGTTGLCSWQASIALSEWCLAHKDLLKDKTILELGSGIGLTGLTIALACEPKKVYLTDCHSSVLKVLCSNIELNVNKPALKQEISCDSSSFQSLLFETITSSNTTIEVLSLPWEDITEKTCEFTNPDLLLAADVIYDSSLFPCFIDAVSCFLGCQNTKELIIACTERNKSTLEEFLNLLVTHGLNYQEFDLAPQKNFVWFSECPVRIFSVKLPALLSGNATMFGGLTEVNSCQRS